MNERSVGRVKNLKVNIENDSLEITVEITDPKFKKKIIRDLSLSGKIEFLGDKIIYKDLGEEDG
jgi:hypothetical protein